MGDGAARGSVAIIQGTAVLVGRSFLLATFTTNSALRKFPLAESLTILSRARLGAR